MAGNQGEKRDYCGLQRGCLLQETRDLPQITSLYFTLMLQRYFSPQSIEERDGERSETCSVPEPQKA